MLVYFCTETTLWHLQFDRIYRYRYIMLHALKRFLNVKHNIFWISPIVDSFHLQLSIQYSRFPLHTIIVISKTG